MLPEIKIFGLVLPTYFTYLSILFSVMLFLTVKKAEKHPGIITPAHALNLCLWIMIPAFVGARLFHVIWESPELYKENFWRMFMVWNGGFVYFGGFLAALLGISMYARWKKLLFFRIGDFFAPLAAVGYGLGRVACFLAGCCYGEYCDLPWAYGGRNPVQLYSCFAELTHAFLLTRLRERPFFQQVPGRLSAVFLICHGLIRFVLEFYRADFRGDFILGLSISSWIALSLIGAGGTILARSSMKQT